jgi:SMC interacting uncharacterized protein involved in chromosome segregation
LLVENWELISFIFGGLVSIIFGYSYMKNQGESNRKDIEKIEKSIDEKIKILVKLDKDVEALNHRLNLSYITIEKANNNFINRFEFQRELDIINKEISTSLKTMEETSLRTERFLNELLSLKKD